VIFSPGFEEEFEKMLVKGFEEAQVRELKRAPTLALFEKALASTGDERESLKTQLGECSAADVWEATRRHRDKYDRAEMRALALEVTGTRYTLEDAFHWYHGVFVDIHAWPGHLEIIGGPMDMSVPHLPGMPRNEYGLRRISEHYEKHMTSTP
jgi:hypothetical protein